MIYGSGAQQQLEADSAISLRAKKTAAALICNRSCAVCLLTQCHHARAHKWEIDCKRHGCMRDNSLKVVDCVIVDATSIE
jgi:hypothetical protein